jgi:hypothetical protein
MFLPYNFTLTSFMTKWLIQSFCIHFSKYCNKYTITQIILGDNPYDLHRRSKHVPHSKITSDFLEVVGLIIETHNIVLSMKIY